MIKSLCVFCGSSSGNNPTYELLARNLGAYAAKQGIAIIYGGAHVGLMGAVADTCLKEGGQVFGVIPQFLQRKEVAHTELTKLYVVESMHERKKMMFDLSDAFVLLPGGLGSLEEICEVLTWGQLGLHQKPCAVLNVNGYYDSLIAQLDRGLTDGFIKQEHRNMFLIINEVNALLPTMQAYRASNIEKIVLKKQV